MRRAPRPLIRLAISVAALAAGLLAVELLARRLGEPLPPRPLVQGDLWQDSADPLLGNEYRPHGTETMTFRLTPAVLGRRVVMTINSQGWRGREYALPKPPGVLRIACVGDSHTAGHGVSDGDTWPDVLQRELDPRNGGRIEVLNFGVGGYGLAQELHLIETRLLDVMPDVIVLALYLNDMDDREAGGRFRERALGGDTAQDPTGELPLAWLCDRSAFVRQIVTSWTIRESSEDYVRSCSARFASDSPEWLNGQQGIRRVRALCEQRGVKLAVLFFPLLVRSGDHLASHAASQAVASFCGRERIPFLDLETCFELLDVDALRLHPLDYHASADAYAVAGKAAARFLARHAQPAPPPAAIRSSTATTADAVPPGDRLDSR